MGATAVIFARGGSKGLPGKNLKTLGGVPLIGHSINVAKRVASVSRIICSTDSKEIARAASLFGAEIPFLRPSKLASDTSPELNSWKHLAEFLRKTGSEPDEVFLSLPTTAPLREHADVERALDKLNSSDADIVVTYSEASNNPWFNMIVTSEAGLVEIANKPDGRSITHRQKAPTVYNLVPVAYATTLRYVLETNDLFAGIVRGVPVPRERAIDVDSSLDFQIAQFLFISRNSSGKKAE